MDAICISSVSNLIKVKRTYSMSKVCQSIRFNGEIGRKCEGSAAAGAVNYVNKINWRSSLLFFVLFGPFFTFLAIFARQVDRQTILILFGEK